MSSTKRTNEPRYDDAIDEHLQRRVTQSQRETRASVTSKSEKERDPKAIRSLPLQAPGPTGVLGTDPGAAFRSRINYETAVTSTGYASSRHHSSQDTSDVLAPSRDDREYGGRGSSQVDILARDGRDIRDSEHPPLPIRDSGRSKGTERPRDVNQGDVQRPKDSEQNPISSTIRESPATQIREPRRPAVPTPTLSAPRRTEQPRDNNWEDVRRSRDSDLVLTPTNTRDSHVTQSRHLAQKQDDVKDKTTKRDPATKEKQPSTKTDPRPHKDSQKIIEDRPDDDDFDGYPFTALKDKVCRIFVTIDIAEHKERIDFLETNVELIQKDVVDQNMTLLFKQAIDFSRMSQTIPSVACVLCLAMIRVSKDRKLNKGYFKRLGESNSDERQAYSATVKALQGLVESTAKAEGPLEVPAPKTAGLSKGKLSLSTFDITQLFGSKIRPDHLIQASDEAPAATDDLSAKYRIRKDARKFFCRGRVFGILWHEGTSKRVVTEDLMQPRQSDRTLSRGPHGQVIYSHFRRMIVVRTRRASCWCVSIGTYGGQGLCKKGLQPDEIRSHTIVHESSKSPQYLRGEPHTDKRPIRVNMADGATLDYASRIHLGKPYCVEYNLRVMDVGRVHEEDLEILVAYVKKELGLLDDDA